MACCTILITSIDSRVKAPSGHNSAIFDVPDINFAAIRMKVRRKSRHSPRACSFLATIIPPKLKAEISKNFPVFQIHHFIFLSIRAIWSRLSLRSLL